MLHVCVCFSPFAIKSALDFFEGMRGASERNGFGSSFFIHSRSPCATEGTHIFFSCAYLLRIVTVFDLPACGQPYSVFGVCACLARVCLLLALANSLPGPMQCLYLEQKTTYKFLQFRRSNALPFFHCLFDLNDI